MIARLALKEAGITYEPVFMDIHGRMSQQLPDRVRINLNMTAPTPVLLGAHSQVECFPFDRKNRSDRKTLKINKLEHVLINENADISES